MDCNIIVEPTALGRTTYVVAEGGMGIVMLTMAKSERSVAILHDLVVDETHRGLGIGRRLMELAEDIAWHQCADIVRLAVESGSWMESWYLRSGYMYAGTSVIDGITLAVMEKDITRREPSEPQTESAISSVD